MRKQRDGVSGFEMPFTARMVETGTDDDGDPITAPSSTGRRRSRPHKPTPGWTPSMQLLRRVLMTILVDTGQDVRPFLDGPEVRACDYEWCAPNFTDNTPRTAPNSKRPTHDARLSAAR